MAARWWRPSAGLRERRAGLTMPHRTPAPSPAAIRQRRYRRRQRDGACVGIVELPPGVVEAMIAAGHLTPATALDAGRLSDAAGAVLRGWAAEVLSSGTRATISPLARGEVVVGGAECRLPEAERVSSVGGSDYGL